VTAHGPDDIRKTPRPHRRTCLFWDFRPGPLMKVDMTSVRCSAIRDALAARPNDHTWSCYLGQVAALQNFYEQTVKTWADRTSLPAEKRERHLTSIGTAFKLMDEWRNRRVTISRKDDSAIQSAISYIRNQALNRNIAPLRVAPVARNAAGLFRRCLHIATFAYAEDQIPTVVAMGVFDIAEVRSLFPIDTANLVSFLPHGASIHAEGGRLDNWHLMIERGADALGLAQELEALYSEAARVWRAFETPLELVLPTDFWSEPGGDFSAKLHHRSMAHFHGR
jgi:hypothetical protein